MEEVEYWKFMIELHGYDLYLNNRKVYKNEVYALYKYKDPFAILNGKTPIVANKIDIKQKYKK